MTALKRSTIPKNDDFSWKEYGMAILQSIERLQDVVGELQKSAGNFQKIESQITTANEEILRLRTHYGQLKDELSNYKRDIGILKSQMSTRSLVISSISSALVLAAAILMKFVF